MNEGPALDRVLDELSLALPVLPDFRAALERIAHVTCEVVPGCSGASVTVERQAVPLTVVATDEQTLALDDIQYGGSSGPCLSALRNDEVILVGDVANERRWPIFMSAAADVGVTMTLSVPLRVSTEVVGVLNIYARDSGFDQRSRPAAEEVARRTAGSVRGAELYFDSRTLADQLRVAMESRAVIEQAKGILMAQSRCSADEAFALLSRASMRENFKLRDIAARIVQGVTGEPPTAA